MIPLRAFRLEARDAEPAGLAVVLGSVRGANDVFNDVLSCGSGLQLGLSGKAARDDHTSNGVRRRRAEGTGTRERGGSAEKGTEGSEARHRNLEGGLRF